MPTRRVVRDLRDWDEYSGINSGVVFTVCLNALDASTRHRGSCPPVYLQVYKLDEASEFHGISCEESCHNKKDKTMYMDLGWLGHLLAEVDNLRVSWRACDSSFPGPGSRLRGPRAPKVVACLHAASPAGASLFDLTLVQVRRLTTPKVPKWHSSA